MAKKAEHQMDMRGYRKSGRVAPHLIARESPAVANISAHFQKVIHAVAVLHAENGKTEKGRETCVISVSFGGNYSRRCYIFIKLSAVRVIRAISRKLASRLLVT